MNIAEILRKVADAVEAEQSAATDTPIENPAELEPINAGVAVDNVENQDAGAEDPVMIPPLQLKVELLKRAVGVDNVYDAGEPRADQTHSEQNFDDELAVMKTRAGIPTAAVMELGNDEITDD
jgi:hypothetical protein